MDVESGGFGGSFEGDELLELFFCQRVDAAMPRIYLISSLHYTLQAIYEMGRVVLNNYFNTHRLSSSAFFLSESKSLIILSLFNTSFSVLMFSSFPTILYALASDWSSSEVEGVGRDLRVVRNFWKRD